MARSAITDVLQVFPFWLMDVAPIEPWALPVLSPLFGFQSVSGPEIQIETMEITEGNWHFRRKVVQKANVSPITLTRGVTFNDSDFWRWTVAAITGNTEAFQPRTGATATAALLAGGLGETVGSAVGGSSSTGGLIAGGLGVAGAVAGAAFGIPRIGGPSPRRRLLLIHFFARNAFGSLGIAGDLIAQGLTSALGALAGADNPASSSFLTAGVGFTGALAPGPFRNAARLPARAYLLHGCIPSRYKLASDFDATSSEVSVMELDIEVEMVEEISLAI